VSPSRFSVGSSGDSVIVSNDVTIQISEELHEHLFMNDEAELAREVERNKSDRD
jgi:hypothetical protein